MCPASEIHSALASYLTIGDHRVSRTGDIWSLPCLWRDSDGLCQRGWVPVESDRQGGLRHASLGDRLSLSSELTTILGHGLLDGIAYECQIGGAAKTALIPVEVYDQVHRWIYPLSY